MAQISRTVSRACIFWKTERPYVRISRKSCEFAFLGAKWWFEATHTVQNSIACYTITLKKKTDTVSERNNINITTFLKYNEYMENSIVGNLSKLPVQTSSEVIVWTYSEKNIRSVFSSYGVWEITFIFHDILSTDLKIENIKVDSSTQADMVLKTTVEKSTQISQHFSDMEKLSQDFSNLLRLSLYPDAKLRCGDRLVPVHRSILAARSQVFSTMFQDQSSDTFDVTDLDDKTLDLLLEYAYSGTVQDLCDSTAISLHGAGKKSGLWSIDPSLGTPSSQVIDFPNNTNWINLLSKGGLIVPSETWIKVCEEFEKIFRSVHGNFYRKTKGVIKELIEELEERFPTVHKKAIRLFCRLRTFIRIRHLNRNKAVTSKRKATQKMQKWINSKKKKVQT